MEDVGIIYGHSEYFAAICYNLWLFGIVCGHFGVFFPILVCLNQEKSSNPEGHS
jgi:hypothetical protein